MMKTIPVTLFMILFGVVPATSNEGCVAVTDTATTCIEQQGCTDCTGGGELYVGSFLGEGFLCHLFSSQIRAQNCILKTCCPGCGQEIDDVFQCNIDLLPDDLADVNGPCDWTGIILQDCFDPTTNGDHNHTNGDNPYEDVLSEPTCLTETRNDLDSCAIQNCKQCMLEEEGNGDDTDSDPFECDAFKVELANARAELHNCCPACIEQADAYFECTIPWSISIWAEFEAMVGDSNEAANCVVSLDDLPMSKSAALDMSGHIITAIVGTLFWIATEL